MSEVTITRLTKTYPKAPRPAVDDLSLDLADGSITALVGPSGCGKSTLAKMIAGLIRPDSGHIRIGGMDVGPLPVERRGVVLMLQQPYLFPHLDVAGNIAFGPAMRGHIPDAGRIETLLDLVQLPGFAGRSVDRLSGGEAQRVALARALVIEPRLLLLDEPLSSLDPTLRADMRQLIADVVRKTSTTALFITHDREEAVTISDRIALMGEGRLLQTGAPADLYERPLSGTVASFFGNDNRIPGHFRDGAFHTSFGTIAIAGEDGPAILTLRPEAIQLDPAGYPAEVLSADYRGSHWLVRVKLGETILTAHLSAGAGAPVRPGEPVRISLPIDRLWQFKD